MDLYDKIANLISNLQKLPEDQKKTIFTIIMAISALIVVVFSVASTKNNVSKIAESVKLIDFNKIRTNELNGPNFNANIPDLQVNDIDNLNLEINNFVSSELQGVFQDSDLGSDSGTINQRKSDRKQRY